MKKPHKKSRKTKPPRKFPNKGHDRAVNDKEMKEIIDSDLEEANNSSVEPDTNDEEFAELVQEYKSFMSLNPDADLGSLLDYNSDYHNDDDDDDNNDDGKDEIILAKTKKNITNRFEFDETLLNFKELNRAIKSFMKTCNVDDELVCDPCEPSIRKLILELGTFYRLGTRNEGKGIERHCVLTKNDDSRTPYDFRKLDRFLEKAQRSISYIQTRKKPKKPAGGSSSKPSNGKNLLSSGTTIGSNAKPLDDRNVGSQILQKLGWSPGQGLGVEKHGRKDPINAIYKSDRKGLGT